MLWLYGASVGGAIISSETYSANIISISTGVLAITLPDITVQCPTLLDCQKKKKKEQVWLFKGTPRFLWIPPPSASSQRKRKRRRRRVGFFIPHLHSESTCRELDGTAQINATLYLFRRVIVPFYQIYFLLFSSISQLSLSASSSSTGIPAKIMCFLHDPRLLNLVLSRVIVQFSNSSPLKLAALIFSCAGF